jgi:hypothetical protein
VSSPVFSRERLCAYYLLRGVPIKSASA